MDYGNFTAYSKKAMERGDKYTAKRIKVEGKIAAALIDALLARGCTISVHDSEEFTVKRSTDKGTIIRALFTTDMDALIARDAEGNKVGWWSLIYGNCGYDVISDHSANEFSEQVWEELQPLIDECELHMI